MFTRVIRNNKAHESKVRPLSSLSLECSICSVVGKYATIFSHHPKVHMILYQNRIPIDSMH
jgi:hypothetical protein